MKPKKKRKANRAAPTPKRKKAKRADYENLRAQFMAHKWETIEDMRAANNIKVKTCYDNTKGWVKARKKMDELARNQADEITLEDRATAIARMSKYQLDVAMQLQLKAFNYLLGKRKNSRGVWVPTEPDSQSTALQMGRLGVSIQQAILLRRPDNDQPPAGNNFNFMGPTQALVLGGGVSSTIRALREFKTDDLKAIIQGDSGSNTTKKSSGPGVAGPDRGKG